MQFYFSPFFIYFNQVFQYQEVARHQLLQLLYFFSEVLVTNSIYMAPIQWCFREIIPACELNVGRFSGEYY